MSNLDPLLTAAAGLSTALWIYLIFFHGRFWRCAERLQEHSTVPARLPVVTAIVPARNEADVIEETLSTLLAQDYPGEFNIILVNDESSDSTASAAMRAAKKSDGRERFHMEYTGPRPKGWVGKMWAINTGVAAAARIAPKTEYLLFTDADVAHSPSGVRRLVEKALSERLDLVSLMVLLESRGQWAGLLIPAFVYFFQKLYPFAWVNDPGKKTAAAAGGCVLVRKKALVSAGGIDRIKGEIIDDCALAQVIKKNGPVWLGLTTTEKSVRPYAGIAGIWEMVRRSAYTQLKYSPTVLAATLAAMAVIYLLPPALLLLWPFHGSARAAILGAAGWSMMAISFMPVLILYGRSRLLSLFLPVAVVLYGAMTLDSARKHSKGMGAVWKGRVGAGSAGARGR